jgi:hypothetical protein
MEGQVFMGDMTPTIKEVRNESRTMAENPNLKRRLKRDQKRKDAIK